MIKLYLASKGVPLKSIYTVDEYPSSAYGNITMVANSLKKNNIRSIIFLTSPYHSLRSLLIWRKNISDVSVIIPNNKTLSARNIQWGVGLNKMRVIVYEYVAIVHNWLAGRI